MDLFSELVGMNTDNEIIEESSNDLFTEAVFPDSLPYNRLVKNKLITLPKGVPTGKGNICILYTHSFKDSLNLMTQTTNFINGHRYYNYYIPQRYRGKLYNRVYNINMKKQVPAYWEQVKQAAPQIRPIRKLRFEVADGRNTYYDIHKYLNIFDSICVRLNIRKKLDMFWQWIKQIIASTTPLKESGFNKVFFLVNCNNYKLSANIKDNMSNPLFALYFTAFKYPELLSGLDVDFYFFADRKSLKINPKDIDEKSYVLIRSEMRKLYAGVVPEDVTTKATDEVTIENDEIVASVTANILQPKHMAAVATTDQNNIVRAATTVVKTTTTTTSTEKTETDVKKDQIEKKIETKAKTAKAKVEENLKNNNVKVSNEEKEKLVEKRLEADMNADTELLGEIFDQLNSDKPPKKSTASSARDLALKTEQEKITVNKMTVSDLRKISSNDVEIPQTSIGKNLRTTNESMKTIRFDNADKEYVNKVMPKDIMNAFLSLNTKSTPMYIRKIDVKETSDNLNYKETYTVYYEDSNRQRHTITVDIPKLIDGRYIYIGGNKKIIKCQLFLNPIVKTAEDTVQIVTNYNKIFMYRMDTKSISSVERLKKLIKADDTVKALFKFGNAFPANKNCITTVEYDELAKIITRYKSKTTTIYFNQGDATKYASSKSIVIPPKHLFIGMNQSSPIFLNIDTQKTRNGKFIIDLIYEGFDEEQKKKFDAIKIPKRLMYTRVKMMKQSVGLLPILAYWEGLTNVLKKAKINFTLVNRASNIPLGQSYIRFNDCAMVYDETVPNALLMNSLRLMKTEDYNVVDFNKPEPYIDYFMKVYGQANILTALNNFYEWMVDPITLERCKYLHLPENIVDMMLYASNLLSDSQFISDLYAGVQRVRRSEVIPAILYESLARSYVPYKNGAGRKKYSMQRDAVINSLLALTTVEESSTLNPTLEMEISHAVTAKGLHGINLDDSYSLPKRTFDKSMIGTITPCQSPDASVGVTKTLTIEPNIMNLRGDIKVPDEKDIKNMKDVNLFSLGDLTIPLGATVDDPTRLGHAMKQSKHVVPVESACPVLISSGLEEVARFHLSDDFVINADEDGEVVLKDEKTNLMIVKYKSGKCKAVSLGSEMVKNGGGGFYLANQLATDLNVGDKVKKNDLIAYHKDFFTNSKYNNCRMNMGTLTKVAIMSAYSTCEDATYITEKLSNDAATRMSFCKSIVIGKNSNLFFLVKEGDHVNVGDPLAIFDTSFDDSDVNNLLASLSDDEKELVETNSRNTVPSKWSGVIKKIMIYSTVDEEELSPSLKKVVHAYYKSIKDRNKILETYDPDSKDSIMKCGILVKDTTEKINPNKYGVIKGDTVVDSVKIEVYIEHAEPLEIGSKVAQFSGLKNTICEIIEKGYEPYSEFHPDEEIGTIIASNSILKRMTPSIILSVLGNKCIIELKRELEKIYKGNA